MDNSMVSIVCKKVSAIKIVLLATIAFIIVTRIICLMHNSELHPDEIVFEVSADSLAGVVLGETDDFLELKEYPEGAYVFQLPFHIVAHILNNAGANLSPKIVGRISAVFYFTVATILGFEIISRYRAVKMAHYTLYGAIMVFSLVHIEQSRYGTGDAISVFLLMAMVILADNAITIKGKLGGVNLVIAAFVLGAMTAVKYPLLVWGLLLVAPIKSLYGTEKKARMMSAIVVTVLAVLVGFMVFSPKAAKDPMYIYRTSIAEIGSYVLSGNLCEAGGKKNHLMSMLVYTLGYSGFPLALLFMGLCWVKQYKACRNGEAEMLPTVLYTYMLPVVTLIFFTYNLFVKTLFMRTYYPFFVLTDIYTAVYVGDMFYKGKWKRFFVILLGVIMAARGTWLVAAMSETDGENRVNALIARAGDENWRSTLILKTPFGASLPIDTNMCINVKEGTVFGDDDKRFHERKTMEMKKGEMVITQTLDHSRCNHYILPVEEYDIWVTIDRWDTFKSVNKEFFIGSAYPQYYYYLFGYWIKGTTGTDYEFPTNYVYYRAA